MTALHKKTIAASLLSIFVAACMSPPLQHPSAGHISAENAPPAISPKIPQPVQQTAVLPKPRPAPKAETYSVVVKDVLVQELLFALARDAKLNVDIHPGITGRVTLNAIDQTLQQLLTRIAKQVDMRWEIDGPNLAVMPDTPYLHTYKVDYVNMVRDVSGSVSISTQIASTSTSAAGTSAATSGSGNNSTTAVTSAAHNHFWESVEKNLKDILRETDKILPEGNSETTIERADQQATTGTGVAAATRGGANQQPSIAGSPNPAALQNTGTTTIKRTTFREAASVIANPEAGVIVVRATSRQHEKVQEYIDQVTTNSRRQVMIEATIAEVQLSDLYQQGIQWQSLRTLRTPGTAGFSVAQAPTGVPVPDPFAIAGKNFLLNYVAPGLGIAATIDLLETFGNVKVLSSPKISVLNNQTAMLKVVDNVVYFEVQSNSTTVDRTVITNTTTTAKSVSVGLVMSITPQISESDMVILNVRPTISRITGYKLDPNPSIPSNIQNKVPEIQTREMESMLRLSNGDIAVMGGLMQDNTDYHTDAVPGLGSLPGIGNLFRQRNDTNKKTELVIFLRPIIIREPSLNGDYRDFRNQLPNKDFFTPSAAQQTGTGVGAQ